MYNKSSSRFNERTSSKLLLLLVIVISFALAKDIYATDNFEAIFPKDCQTNVTTAPLIKIRAAYPIDTNSITKLEYGPNDTNFIGTNAILIRKDIYDNNHDSTYQNLGESVQVAVADTFDLYVLGQNFLNYNTEYTLILKDNIKLLKPNDLDPNVIDTLTEPQTFDCLFKTKDYPLQPIANNIPDNAIIGCDDSVKIYFNRKLDITSYQLNKLCVVQKIGNVIELGDGKIDHEIDTISHTINLAPDSTHIIVKPSTIDYDNSYYVEINSQVLNGIDGLNPSYQFNYSDHSSVQILTKAENPSDTLPESIVEINGAGVGILNSGDTLNVAVPPIEGDFVFDRWAGIEHLTNVTTYLNELRIIGDCNNVQPIKIAAIYKRIPLDTLFLDSIRINPDAAAYTCSPYVVRGYQDSLNPYLYTFKRFSNLPLDVSVNLCNGYNIDKWNSSSDSTIDGSTGTSAITDRNYRDMIDDITNNMNKYLHLDLTQFGLTCTTAKIKVVFKFTEEAGAVTEFASDDIEDVISSFSFNGTNYNPSQFASLFIENSTNKITENTFIFNNEFPKIDVPYSFTLSPSYAIRRVNKANHDGNNPKTFDVAKYDYDGQTITYSGYISVLTNFQGCMNTLTVDVTRRLYKVEYEITDKDGGKIPSLDIADVAIIPQPSEYLNQRINGYSGFFTGNYRFNKIERTFDPTTKHTTKIKVETFHRYNETIYATRIINKSIGWSNYRWNNTGIFTYPTPATDLSFNFTLTNSTNTAKVSKILRSDLSSDFRLDEIWTIQGVDILITNEKDSEWIKHLVNPSKEYRETNPNIKLWDHYTGNNITGDGLYSSGHSAGNTNKMNTLNPFQFKTPILKLVFNKAVDPISLKNNFKVYDGKNPHRFGNSTLRRDGLPEREYEMVNALSSNQFKNVFFSNNQSVVDFHFQSKPDSENETYFMPHFSNYYVEITNIISNNNKSIYNYDLVNDQRGDEKLTNILTSSIENYSILRRTSFPRFQINNIEMLAFPEIVDKNQWWAPSTLTYCYCPPAGFYTYSHVFLNNSLGNMITETNELKNNRFGIGDNYLVKLKATAFRYPNIGASQNYKILDNTTLFHVDQLSYSNLSILTHYIRDYEQNEPSPLEFLLDIGIDILNYVAPNPVTTFMGEVKNKATEKLKNDQNTKDEYMTNNILYLNEDGTINNWDSKVYFNSNSSLEIDMELQDRVFDPLDKHKAWVNWGAGPYGLYKNKSRFSLNPDLQISKIKINNTDKITVQLKILTLHNFNIKVY